MAPTPNSGEMATPVMVESVVAMFTPGGGAFLEAGAGGAISAAPPFVGKISPTAIIKMAVKENNFFMAVNL